MQKMSKMPAMLRFFCFSASHAGVAVQTVQTQPYLLLSSHLRQKEHEQSCNNASAVCVQLKITASTARSPAVSACP